MAKESLSITRCNIDAGTGKVDVISGASYKLLINPAEFSHERSICYNTKRTLGQNGNPVRFSAVNPDKIGFSVVFDGTGAVPPQAGTPADVVARLNAEVNAALKQPEVAEKLLGLGMTPVGGTPEQFGAFVRADIDKWTRLIRARNIKPD